jgi:hypothetical protein
MVSLSADLPRNRFHQEMPLIGHVQDVETKVERGR